MGLLNAIDWLVSQEGHILIMTTNYPKRRSSCWAALSPAPIQAAMLLHPDCLAMAHQVLIDEMTLMEAKDPAA
jgi:hypothetical protein